MAKLKTTFFRGGWVVGWVAGEMENKAIFQLEVEVELAVTALLRHLIELTYI